MPSEGKQAETPTPHGSSLALTRLDPNAGASTVSAAEPVAAPKQVPTEPLMITSKSNETVGERTASSASKAQADEEDAREIEISKNFVVSGGKQHGKQMTTHYQLKNSGLSGRFSSLSHFFKFLSRIGPLIY